MRIAIEVGIVRAYLTKNPDASPTTVAAALKAKGIRTSISLASAVKYRKPKRGGRRSGRLGQGRAKAVVGAGSNNSIIIHGLIAAKRLAERIGGIERAREALAVLAQLT